MVKMAKCSYTNIKDTSSLREGSITKQVRYEDKKQFLPFVDKKVTVVEERETLAGNRQYEHQGRIKKENGNIFFMKKGSRSRGKDITAGVFDGFHATLTIRKIKPCW